MTTASYSRNTRVLAIGKSLSKLTIMIISWSNILISIEIRVARVKCWERELTTEEDLGTLGGKSALIPIVVSITQIHTLLTTYPLHTSKRGEFWLYVKESLTRLTFKIIHLNQHGISDLEKNGTISQIK